MGWMAGVLALRARAANGDGEALNALGDNARWGGRRDIGEAARLYVKGAGKGNADAGRSLGWMRWRGEGGTLQDWREACRAWREAAEKGHPEASYLLGDALLQGFPVGEHSKAQAGHDDALVEARRWMEVGAEGGYPPAMHNLGVMLLRGEGGEAGSEGEAEQWLEKGFEGGVAASGAVLGDLAHDAGDAAGALEWWVKAAALGDAGAAMMLGYAYRTGAGVGESEVEAATWFARAAKAGHPEAQFALAECYESGSGIRGGAVDEHEAYLLYAKAAGAGHAEAAVRVAQLRTKFKFDRARQKADEREGARGRR